MGTGRVYTPPTSAPPASQPATSAPASAPAAAAPRTYPSLYYATPGFDMSIPGASEYAVSAYAPTLQAKSYAENYASAPAYSSAQQNTATNQLLGAYGASVATPSQYENYAYSTPAPTGNAYGTIAANQNQVSGTNPVTNYAKTGPQVGATRQQMGQQAGLVSGPSQLSYYAQSGPSDYSGQGAYNTSLYQVNGPNGVLDHGYLDTPDSGVGNSTFGGSQDTVGGPTRIGGYMDNPAAYNQSVSAGTGYGTANSTRGMVTGNTLGQYAQDPNAQYLAAGNNTASQRELASASNDMSSGLDPSTASGQYWNQLQQNPTALPPANLDAYYDRQREKSQADLDKAMAARGLFGSSASVDATRQMLLDLGAQQVKDESDYGVSSALARNDIMSGAARDADSSGIARYTARNAAAQGVDQAALGLGQLGLSARSENDANTLARYTAQNNVANSVDQLGQNLYLGRGNLANQSDQTDATRFSALNSAANAVDQSAIDAYNARTGALQAGGQLDVSRFAQNNQAAQGLDQNSIASYNAQAGALGDAGALDVNRYNAATNAGNLADRVGLDAYTAQGNLLNNAGQLDVSRFNANTGATNTADQVALDRYTQQASALKDASTLGLDRYKALVDSATAADNSARSLYQTGSDVSSAADQSINNRLGTLIQGVGQADLSRTGRTQVAQGAAQDTASLLDSILNSGYGGLIQSDQDLLQLITELGLGAGAQNLQGAIGSQNAVGGNGALGVNAGAASDSAATQALLASKG